MITVVDLEKLSKELLLTDKQVAVLSDALEKLIKHYDAKAYVARSPTDTYFSGIAEGLNNAYKVINGINDDYNASE